MAERRSWIDPGDRLLSIRAQCELLGLHRSNVYYEPVPVSQEDLQLMRRVDEEYLHLGSVQTGDIGNTRSGTWVASIWHTGSFWKGTPCALESVRSGVVAGGVCAFLSRRDHLDDGVVSTLRGLSSQIMNFSMWTTSRRRITP